MTSHSQHTKEHAQAVSAHRISNLLTASWICQSCQTNSTCGRQGQIATISGKYNPHNPQKGGVAMAYYVVGGVVYTSRAEALAAKGE